MSKYLIPHILFAKRIEMAQYLYFIVSNVDMDIIEVTNNLYLDLKLVKSNIFLHRILVLL